jgi:hypothetical protein
MEPPVPSLRLDPSDPLASVLAWLAALAAALGLELGVFLPRVELDRRGAADVRRLLADWSAKLRALVRAKAIRLALARRRINFPLPLVGRGLGVGGRPVDRSAEFVPANLIEAVAAGPRDLAAPHPLPPPHQGEGKRLSAPLNERRPWGVFALSPRRCASRSVSRASRPAWWEQPDAPIGAVEDLALRRRMRAVLLALKDPGPLVRRLARRLFAARGPSPEPARRPRPPRTLGAAPTSLSHTPEPRPPDSRAAPLRALSGRAARGSGFLSVV